MPDDQGTLPSGASAVADSGQLFAVRISIDGRDVPLKVFLHDMIGGAVSGLILGLRDVGEPERIDIQVRKV